MSAETSAGRLVIAGSRIHLSGRGVLARWSGIDELDAPASEVSANRVVVGRSRGLRVRCADGRWWIFFTREPEGILPRPPSPESEH